MLARQVESFSDEEIFALLHPLVRRWFTEKFSAFSPPQRFAIPHIHNRKNCLISAPTGSGKTLAAFLAIINELVQLSSQNALQDQIYCVYVSPLKALGNDIERNLQEPLREMEALAGQKLNIRVEVRTGDTSAERRQRMLKKPPHILITTPESLAIALAAKQFSNLFSYVQWVIVDEVHSLAENKRGVHLSLSLERLQELSDFTRVGLSATVSPLDEVAKFLVGRRYGRVLAPLSDGDDPWRDCVIIDARFEKKLDLQVLSPVDDFVHCSFEELNANLYALLDGLIRQHRTTLIFTNTRALTERVVHTLKEKFPHYVEVIGAHHSSLSKELRLDIERKLKNGELKVVVSSTSLELGIDIGYIDLVILLGSPKSVTRALQRVGRSGHKLHDTIKGRVVVTDQDDLVECAVMLRSALQHKLEKLHIPKNCLDVLAQQIFGIVLDGPIYADDLYELVTRSYNFADLSREHFEKVLEYLAGEYTDLEDRHVYAKIYYDKETGQIRARGRLARVLYMTNVGTIPDESYIIVKAGNRRIGQIEEGFLEMLRKHDTFVLGGETYKFKFSRGMTIQVESADEERATVPSWFSEMLPLSFELALDIQEFRSALYGFFARGASSDEIKEYIRSELQLDARGVESLYRYFAEQHRYSRLPHRRKLLIEFYHEGPKTIVIFHALFGRRVNDALSRALAYLIARREDKDIEIAVTDHGFYLAYEGSVRVMEAFDLLKERDLREVLRDALRDTEILKRRFRHCATRALMILRSYKGRRKSVGRQQLKASILQSAVERMDEYFPILTETYREVMEDAMDIENAQRVIDEIRSGQIELEGFVSPSPSPFALHIVMHARSDIIKVEDRQQFLQRMYERLQLTQGVGTIGQGRAKGGEE
jgi:ATP-dependent Lhr-like helicase